MMFKEKFDNTVTMGEVMPQDISELPPIIIYHYVENALYPSILNLDGKEEIEISFSYQVPYLVCTITDNGCGREAAKTRNKKRDLNDTTPYKELLRDRIRVLNDEVSGRISMNVQDMVSPDGKPAGTRVVLQILVSSRAVDPIVFDY